MEEFKSNNVKMSFQKHLIFFGVLCIYRVAAGPAIARPALADRQVLADPALAAGPALADSKVQNWARLAPVANQALSSAEQAMGNAMISKLDVILKDPSRADSTGKRLCLNYIDLQFVLDSSGSIGRSEFLRAIEALKNVVDYVDYRCSISKYGSQVGLIEFSSPSQTHVEFSLGDNKSRWSVNNAIDRVGYDSGYSTATANALRLAKTEFNQNAEPRNDKVAWILTDGNSNSGGDPKYAAQALKDMGVMVCVVAIGNSINTGEINDIASNGCSFKASSFTILNKMVEFAAAEGRANDFKTGQTGQQSPRDSMPISLMESSFKLY